MLVSARVVSLVVLVSAAVAWPARAADEKKDVRPAAEKSAADKPAEKAPEARPDPYAVPDGSPKELVDYINKLIQTTPRNPESVKKARQAVLKAANKILAGKPSDGEMEIAVRFKMNMLEKLEDLKDFAAELKKGGHAKLLRQVEVAVLQLELRASMAGGPEKMRQALRDTVKFLEASPPQASEVGLGFMAGHMAEVSGDPKLACEVYESLAKAFGRSADTQLVDFSKVLQGAIRRLKLPGTEMKVEGKVLGGKEIDWPSFRGKVVLVDFWATWCGPCVHEIPNMLKCYEQYHDKGFDIVGLSLDRSAEDLEKFVKQRKLPWTIVFGDGKPSNTVNYYGIMGIPTMILVGKDGKVLSTNARGDNLNKELEKLLGPVEEKKEEKKSGKDEDKKPGEAKKA